MFKIKIKLKIKISLCRSIDRYDTDPGGQATYLDGHKIFFSLWRKWIREEATGRVLKEKVFLEISQGLQLY